MRYTTIEILESKTLQKTLLDCCFHINEITWNDKSITKNKDYFLELVDEKISICSKDSLWSEPIDSNQILDIYIDIKNGVFTDSEAICLLRITKEVLVKNLSKLQIGIDYRKSGNMYLITASGMLKLVEC